MMQNVLQSLVDSLSRAGNAALNLLPLCPFYNLQTFIEQLEVSSEVFAFISWLVPFPAIAGLLTAWASAVLGWYFVKKILRFANIAQ
ncbi:MAG: hypothetical protein FWC08_14195 [Defluviitaleaceae bacterium]|nr:hypothetical protein [Defluviitaleaceae bacterium]